MFIGDMKLPENNNS